MAALSLQDILQKSITMVEQTNSAASKAALAMMEGAGNEIALSAGTAKEKTAELAGMNDILSQIGQLPTADDIFSQAFGIKK